MTSKENKPMIKETITAFSIATLTIFTAAHNFNQNLPTPVKINKVSEDITRIKARYALEYLGAPTDRINRLVNAVHAGSVATGGIDPVLIASIIRPESEFNVSAKSKKGYKGLMQTPKATMNWNYAEADVVYGSLILRDHIQEAKGNIAKGMIHYKGHGGKESQMIAEKQMKLYNEVKTVVNKRIKEEKSNG
jgi:hypothetical protein